MTAAASIGIFALSIGVQAQTITTIAGNGTGTYAGDGGPATGASLNFPYEVARDSAGNLYVADSNNYRVRKVTPAGTISTVAGTGTNGYSGDGGAATDAKLGFIGGGVAVDSNDDLYIADTSNNRIRKVIMDTGVISTVAGNGSADYSGDGGQATAAGLNPQGVAVAGNGDLYVADQQNNRIRKIDATTGAISTVAGTGGMGFSGDGLLAINATLNFPRSVAVDASGNLLIADQNNDCIRKVTEVTGNISTVAGIGGVGGFNGDGGPATDAWLENPNSIALDAAGNFYISHDGNRVRKVTAATGLIVTVAGTGTFGYSGDGGPATDASLNGTKVTVDAFGNIYFADTSNQRIRKVTKTGDGKSDLVWRNSGTGGDTIWKSASSSTPQSVSTVSDLNWQIVGAGDFDGDGKSDLMWRHATSGANTIWKSGNSATTQSVTVVSDANWKVVGVGDFDGDGKSDLMWRHATSGANTIWKSANSSTQQSVATVSDANWKVVGVGDFDGDGKSDLMWRHATSGANTIWKSGNSATAQSVTAVSDANWKVVGVGYFDSDGKSDLMWRHATSGANTIWKSGNSATTQSVTAVSDANWKVVDVGDFDGDGKSDLMWRHATSGANTIWKSANSSTQQSVATVSDANWKVAGVGDF